jgi:uncharacterized protein (TIGR03435 family)
MRLPLSLLLLAASAFAQTFDVASVKSMHPEQLGALSEKIVAHPGSVSMRNIRLRGLIKWAYDVKEYQVAAPSWMGSPGWQGSDIARYEIVAKAPKGADVAHLRLMMQALLAERFHLVLHRETREMPVLVMTVAKPRAGIHPASDAAAEPRISGRGGDMFVNGMSMAEFAELMAGPLHLPILDRTGLSGRFDFTLSGKVANDDDISAALAFFEDQLGLKLQRQKAPIEILVVDRADQKPTEN